MNYETQKQLLALRFSCAFCGYGSKLELKACPGCGRVKRDEKPNLQTTAKKSEISRFLLMLGITLFIGALGIFLGLGPSQYRQRVKIIAGVGENWETALIFFVVGLGCVVAGMILKSRE